MRLRHDLRDRLEMAHELTVCITGAAAAERDRRDVADLDVALVDENVFI